VVGDHDDEYDNADRIDADKEEESDLCLHLQF
jgi:hypothetical protein